MNASARDTRLAVSYSRWLLAAVVCWLVLGTSLAGQRARAAAPALHWVRARGAEGCIDPIELARRVEALTGPVFVPAAAAELSLTGEAAPEGKSFRVRIALSGSDGRIRGERIVRGRDRDCRKLDPALAFIMALTLDPSLSLANAPAEVLASFAQEVPPEETLLAELAEAPAREDPVQEALPELHAVPPSQPAPPPSQPRPDAGEESRTRGVAYQLGVGAQALGLVLPSFAPGAVLSFGVVPLRWLSVSFGFEFAFGVGMESLPSEGRASFSAMGGFVRACPRLFSWQRLSLSGCVGVALSQLRARGSDFRQNFKAQLSLPAFQAGLLAWLALPRSAALWADLSARARLAAQEFRLTDTRGAMQLAHRPGPVGLQMALGAGYLF